MTLSRRTLIQAAPALMLAPTLAHAASELKISHQFPGGTLTEGDFRDRLCRRFAAEVDKRTGAVQCLQDRTVAIDHNIAAA